MNFFDKRYRLVYKPEDILLLKLSADIKNQFQQHAFNSPIFLIIKDKKRTVISVVEKLKDDL